MQLSCIHSTLSANRIVALQRLVRIDPERGERSLVDLQPLWRPRMDFACFPYHSQKSAHIARPATSFGPRAHAGRYAFHQQTKNRIQANLVSFVQVRAYKVLILDHFDGLLIIHRLISPLSLSCAYRHSSPLARPSTLSFNFPDPWCPAYTVLPVPCLFDPSH